MPPDVTASGLLFLRTWLDPATDERFSAWCDGHHAEHLAVDGFRRVRRGKLMAAEAPDPARVVTVYDLDDTDVLHSDAYEAYRRSSSGLPADLAAELRFARAEATETTRTDADGPVEPNEALVEGGPALLTLFLAAERPAGQSLALLDDLDDVALAVARTPGVSLVRHFTTATGDHILLAEVEDPDPLTPGDLPRPQAATPAEAWGLYLLEHCATP